MPIFKRPRNHPLRYYVYISQTKLEILIPQIPARLLRSLEAEIKINVSVFAAGVKKTASAPSPELAAKAGVLGNYLEKQTGWVGTLTDPGRYVKGVASLQYGVMRDYAAELAIFGGEVDGVKIALIGSPASLIGVAADTAANHSLDYYVLKFLRGEAESARGSSEGWTPYEAAVDGALNAGVLPPTCLRLEFLAKPLFYNDRVLVATPIYVALAD
ncbi:SAVMC3_10250 family protein [Streptomyces sp. NPDC046805]|uniref:DUF7019 family protein n=1 Tax=Streptomyces sp. NPDC046805 TaxID=3155134 RepID=UPI0033EBA92E